MQMKCKRCGADIHEYRGCWWSQGDATRCSDDRPDQHVPDQALLLQAHLRTAKDRGLTAREAAAALSEVFGKDSGVQSKSGEVSEIADSLVNFADELNRWCDGDDDFDPRIGEGRAGDWLRSLAQRLRATMNQAD